MSDASTPGVAQDITMKWWGHSLTIRGALISAASAALPALGTLVGLDLDAETMGKLGQQAVTLAQAAGGLLGFATTVVGRMRASAPLTRRSVNLMI